MLTVFAFLQINCFLRSIYNGFFDTFTFVNCVSKGWNSLIFWHTEILFIMASTNYCGWLHCRLFTAYTVKHAKNISDNCRKIANIFCDKIGEIKRSTLDRGQLYGHICNCNSESSELQTEYRYVQAQPWSHYYSFTVLLESWRWLWHVSTRKEFPRFELCEWAK
jgi:hypothetical protein